MLTAEKKKYTVKDYEMLEEGAPFQLIEHDLVMSPSPLPVHQIISGKLFNVISNFLSLNNNNGVVMYAPVDVQFEEGNVFQPDLIFIAEDRTHIIENKVYGAPDMVIEILSPSTAIYDLRQKKDVYERYGVTEYIIIDPVSMNADLYSLTNGIYAIDQKVAADGVLNSIILPGLTFDLKSIFKI